MDTVRLRLVFENALTKLPQTQGLKRCWILLKPDHLTISDLSSYVLNVFDLHGACPNGLILSMEGFALPPFESTCIFNNKDIIRVKRKGGDSTAIVEVDDGKKALEVVEIVNTQPMATSGMNLLANEEFEKESGGYESETEDDSVSQDKEDALDVEISPELDRASKKRKASMELPRTKREKNTSASAEKRAFVLENVGNDFQDGENETLSTPVGDERNKKNNKALSKSQRFFQPQENGNGSADASLAPSRTEKCPSRSSRRKKAKRRWLRERRAAEEQQQKQLLGKINLQSSEKDNQSIPQKPYGRSHKKNCQEIFEKENNKLEESHQQQVEDGDTEDNVVPVQIRPGHIRFESPSKVGAHHAEQQDPIPVNTFQWSGITSKKKGQKWGKEKVASGKRNKHNNFNQEDSEMLSFEDDRPDRSSLCNNSIQESSEILAIDEDVPENGHIDYDNHIDYDKLPLYASLPKEGDVIAYRMIELSSTWTPEPSSYRVGKISWYDPQSNRILLLPLPEYPMRETHDGACPGLQETSLYGEDGSLEADYSSLLEVRIISHDNRNSAESVPRVVNKALLNNQDPATCLRANDNIAERVSVQEKGEANVWEDIHQALNQKKAQLSQGVDGSKTECSGRRPWSFKALRGSAVGPTIALLRSQNEL